MERQQQAMSAGVEALRLALCTSKQHLSTVLAKLSRWGQMSKDSVELARMSDNRLRDIGLSRADVMKETVQPFWHDPLRR